MEQNLAKKFVCKYCNKKYPCGKSLGGHIRIHFTHNRASREDDDEIELIDISKVNLGLIGGSGSGSGSGQSSYGLRENPKKTRRFAIPNSGNLVSKQERLLCKECGKGFQSLKALCGHMACHSEKDKLIKNVKDLDSANSCDEKQQQLVMDSQSETETSAPSRRRRSKRMKFKMIVGAYDPNSSFNGNYSSVFEMEQEQEEVAMCLIMLSRDSGYRKAWNSVIPDSSDDNSVVLETKSSSIDMRITTAKHGVDFGNENLMMKKKLKSKTAEIELSENSDSGYFNNGPKKVYSDASVDGSYEFKRTNAGFGFGFDQDFLDDVELGKKRKFKKSGGATSAAAKSQEFLLNYVDKRTEYECVTCSKVFHSHRSLWGHQASHSRITGCYQPTYGSGENSIENENDPVPVNISSSSRKPDFPANNNNPQKKLGSKKIKGHQCPICFRMFKSGQALGGHKRSHFMGASADNETVVINQELSKMPDLNLPAPDEEDATGHTGFVPW